ncbi:MAG: hypothetical protein EON61_04805 [Alphaproteobacteria bacterium]|jgi:hypothetical protein|nr:MAG: hypothetical protein EON61_04805 [Alphaproteobacteria bacterium]
MTDPSELDAAILRMRLAVLNAGFRKLRYRISPDELVALVAQKRTDNQAFDQIERKQPMFTRMRIFWKRMRHGDHRER